MVDTGSDDSDTQSHLERFLILVPIVIVIVILVLLPNLCGVTGKIKAD